MEREEEWVTVRFRDSGMGIEPGDMPRIWDRLYRGDKSRNEQGLGLGLSFVKAVIEAMGGTVSAESEPGRGSLFTVALPVAEPETAPPATPDGDG